MIIQIKRGLQSAISRLELAEGELAVALDTGNVYIGTTAGNVHINPSIATVDSADKLSNKRNFSISGDATAQAVAFDGTQNVNLSLTLPDIATAGTYPKVTVNSKGQVTGGTTLTVSDLPNNIPVSKLTGVIADTQKGVAGGIATLDNSGKVPTAQLPSYVDDVLEFDNKSVFPATGESGKIYIAKDTNKTYRWSGTAYIEISASLTLGETSATAYRGDRGKIAYDHSLKSGNPHGTTASDVGAAPSSHTSVMATSAQLGHVKAGTGLSVSNGVLSISSVDGGTF